MQRNDCLSPEWWVNGSRLNISFYFLKSIILNSELEVCLRVGANRADLRRFLADYDVTAVAALPNYDAALLNTSPF